MNKQRLASKIIKVIDNCRFVGDNQEQVQEAVEDVLSALVPRDIECFADWGAPEDKSTIDKCWE